VTVTTRPPRARAVRVGNPRHRCVGLLLVLAVAFSAVGLRLVNLQVVNPDEYASRGVAQRLRVVDLPAERGSIFDRNGVELAMSVRQQTVWADPRLVDDPATAAARLAPVLGVDQAELQANLSREAAFTYLARQVDDEVARQVEALDIPGVSLIGESKRFAPAGDLARSVLGDVDLDNLGLSGLEQQYESKLVGTPGELLIERGPDGRTIAGGEQKVTPASRGNDLVLTLDRSLQFEVERALAEEMVDNGAERASSIVMDPATGEILALANLRMTDEGPRPSRDNWALTAAFEPGSVNKVITLAGALEEGLYEPASVLEVPDHHKVSVHTFSDHDPHPTAQWSIADILTQSSNVGTIKVAQALGESKVKDYLRLFGLGQRTGLDFPQETPGIMNFDRWNGTDIGSIPIGQGVAVNALQMLQVFNTLANGGVWIEPQIVRSTVDGDGAERPIAEPRRRRVVSEKTADQMTAMLANVVAVGTGVNAQIPGYTVSGKTGTARKPDAVNRGYETGAYISSFAGFVPAESPRLSAIVVMDEPRPVYYAGLVAAPVFARISKYALRLLRIPPPSQGLAAEAAVPAAQPVDVAVRD
jgi:cell division protein FtsI (penicillin-binding protein 3)